MSEFLQINFDLIGTISTIASGGALGGVISLFLNRKVNKRIKESEAVQSEAVARREDASAATEMMGLLERTVSHMEKMNSYNETNSESLLRMVEEKDRVNEQMKKDMDFLKLQRAEDHRRIVGLEKKVECELEWRKESDYHYCEIVDCEVRKPPIGTFRRG